MAIVDKTSQRFDEVTKKDRIGLLNALIYSSHNISDYRVKLNNSDLKLEKHRDKLIIRLIPTLEYYRTQGRLTSFGSSTEEVISNFSFGTMTKERLETYNNRLGSLITPGGEMGIWKNSDLELSDFAIGVAENRITSRFYISVVFLNLFSFFQDKSDEEHYLYKHFLFEILTHFKQNGPDKEYSREILLSIFNFENEKNNTKKMTQRNILLDYLKSTLFFDLSTEQSNFFKLTDFCKKMLDEIINICNLEYENESLESVTEQLNRDNRESSKRYANYVSKNKVELEVLLSEYNLNFINKTTKVHKEKKNIQGNNLIYFGAPGTGKSYNLKNYIRRQGLTDYDENIDHPNVFRTTLHPEFSYHDFVGQILPKVTKTENNSNVIEYGFEPKIFTKSLEASLIKKGTEPIFLILEEMSRANIASVFGDLFQLLDRDINGESEYRINNDLIAKYLTDRGVDNYSNNNKIYLPSNLFIIGTVNTSDQNVFVMDTAFKRRFEFEYIDVHNVAIDETTNQPLNNYKFTLNQDDGTILAFEWIDFISSINQFIVRDSESGGLGLSEDKQIGQFFIKFKDDDDEFNNRQLSGKLLQYLWHDVKEASFSDRSLFAKNINSFSDLYNSFKKGRQIFSVEFLNFYKAILKRKSDVQLNNVNELQIENE